MVALLCGSKYQAMGLTANCSLSDKYGACYPGIKEQKASKRHSGKDTYGIFQN